MSHHHRTSRGPRSTLSSSSNVQSTSTVPRHPLISSPPDDLSVDNINQGLSGLVDSDCDNSLLEFSGAPHPLVVEERPIILSPPPRKYAKIINRRRPSLAVSEDTTSPSRRSSPSSSVSFDLEDSDSEKEDDVGKRSLRPETKTEKKVRLAKEQKEIESIMKKNKKRVHRCLSLCLVPIATIALLRRALESLI